MIQALRAILVFSIAFLVAAASLTGQSKAPQRIEIPHEQFSDTLKTIWSFLKEQTDAFRASVDARGEFESTVELNERIKKERRELLMRIGLYTRANEYHRKIFTVAVPARLLTFDPDKLEFQVRLDTTIAIPYSLPTMKTVFELNDILVQRDGIEGGYRTSVLRLKNDIFIWRTSKDQAEKARQSPGTIFFEFDFVIDLRQDPASLDSRMGILFWGARFVNKGTMDTYWSVSGPPRNRTR